jgi:hypothetical protein
MDVGSDGLHGSAPFPCRLPKALVTSEGYYYYLHGYTAAECVLEEEAERRGGGMSASETVVSSCCSTVYVNSRFPAIQ